MDHTLLAAIVICTTKLALKNKKKSVIQFSPFPYLIPKAFSFYGFSYLQILVIRNGFSDSEEAK